MTDTILGTDQSLMIISFKEKVVYNTEYHHENKYSHISSIPSFPRGLKFKKYILYQLIGIYVLLYYSTNSYA